MRRWGEKAKKMKEIVHKLHQASIDSLPHTYLDRWCITKAIDSFGNIEQVDNNLPIPTSAELLVVSHNIKRVSGGNTDNFRNFLGFVYVSSAFEKWHKGQIWKLTYSYNQVRGKIYTNAHYELNGTSSTDEKLQVSSSNEKFGWYIFNFLEDNCKTSSEAQIAIKLIEMLAKQEKSTNKTLEVLLKQLEEKEQTIVELIEATR